ncbi:exonuclease domain-containing protein [Bifidobacterium cuniculi]|uniref:Exonuclease n=1 Tax=Bifidobacterium cuniculi TaxID=1688 RepID=A0A087B0K8_9BIFI|nr:exonuclease domain-containing protein [Bifidobacterium cuniculi]KFI64558.1 exonuclease [Bifidobacterium cuniculi]
MALDFTAVQVALGAKDAICAIGAVRVRDGKIVETYRQLINPGMGEFMERYVKTNGRITAEDVQDAPSFAQAWPGFMTFLGDDVMAVFERPQSVRAVLDLELARAALGAPCNGVFDVRDFFDTSYPDPAMRGKGTYVDMQSTLYAAERVVLRVLKRRPDTHDVVADATAIARIAVDLCHAWNADSLVQADAISVQERQKEGDIYTAFLPSLSGESPSWVDPALRRPEGYAHPVRAFRGWGGWRRAPEVQLRPVPPLTAGDERPEVTGAELRETRLEAGLSVEAMAVAAECSATEVLRFEMMDVSDSERAWAYADAVRFALKDLREEAWGVAEDIMEAYRRRRLNCALYVDYYRDQADYDRFHADGKRYELVNYRQRCAVVDLGMEGYSAFLRYRE